MNAPARRGCYNREPLKDTITAQTGWSDWFRDGFGAPTRVPIYQDLPDPMTKDCQYSKTYGDDPACAGCVRNQKEHHAAPDTELQG